MPAIKKPPGRPPKVVELSQEAINALAEQLAMGYHPRDIARTLHPKNPRGQQAAKRRIERLIQNDPRIYNQVLDHVKADIASSIGPAMRGLVRRADKGNVHAARLILEIAGVHNPRVRHEHKGDIKIKLEGLPRPRFEDTGNDADSIVDADVVE